MEKVLHTSYQVININGKEYSVNTINSLSQDKSWLMDISDFLTKWWDKDPFIELQTSGSTGEPKKIKFHKNALVASAHATINTFNLKEGNTLLLCLPMQYIAGKMMVIRSLIGNMPLIAIKPEKYPSLELNTLIDFAAMMPYQFIHSFNENHTKLDKIKTVILGGMKLPEKVHQMSENLSTNVYETYGMTETLTHVAIRQIGKEKTFSAIQGVSFSVDIQGCLIIHAPHILNEEINTNDIVDLKNNRQFELIGRKDLVINSGGIKLFPQSIENKLSGILKSPFFVTSKEDIELGDHAVLVTEDEITDSIKERITSKLDKIEIPKEFIKVKKIILTESGKIARMKTKKKYNLF